MENFLINLICELDDKPSELKLCSLQQRKLLKYKKRNLLLQFMCGKKRRIPKVLDYHKVIKLYPDDIFFDHFRMSRSTFEVSVPIYVKSIKVVEFQFSVFAVCA